MIKRMPLLLIALLFLLAIDKNQALALAETCPPNAGPLRISHGNNLDPLSGVTVQVTVDEPQNVVVVGQDPDEFGVNLTVEITSLPGVVEHSESVATQVCRHSTTEQPGSSPCNKRSSPDWGKYGESGYYYYQTETSCIRHYTDEPPNILPQKIYRKVSRVRVWLQPSLETERWLGWSMTTPSGRSSLRYIYPDRWMVGTWQGDDFTTQRTLDYRWDVAYYQEWLKRVGTVNFLAGDSFSGPLWSVAMPIVASPFPTGSDQIGVMSLGISGEMGVSPPFAGSGSIPSTTITEDVNCIDLKTHYRTMGPNFSEFLKKSAQINCPSNPPYDDNDGKYTLTFEHIPIDLPGQWYIGVMVEVQKARFLNIDSQNPYGIMVTEDPGSLWDTSEDTQWFPKKDYNEVQYDPQVERSGYFFSYILLTSPCNDQELDGCFDGTN